MTKQEAYKTFRCWHCVYLDNDKGICLCGDTDSDDCPKDYTAELGGNQVSDDLISRKALLEVIDISFIIPILKMNLRPEHEAVLKIREIIMKMPTAFDKEKIIEELKSWEKASHDAGIQSTYAELDNKASGYYQESRAYHRAIEIVEKGGIE